MEQNKNLADTYIQFRDSQKTVSLNSKIFYDVKGQSEYLTESELFSLFIKENSGQKP